MGTNDPTAADLAREIEGILDDPEVTWNNQEDRFRKIRQTITRTLQGSLPEHTILVAFSVHGKSRAHAQDALMRQLPEANSSDISSWWIAEDDRRDGSDCDSAVFVTPGMQYEASLRLNRAGLTPRNNIVTRDVRPDFQPGS